MAVLGRQGPLDLGAARLGQPEGLLEVFDLLGGQALDRVEPRARLVVDAPLSQPPQALDETRHARSPAAPARPAARRLDLALELRDRPAPLHGGVEQAPLLRDVEAQDQPHVADPERLPALEPAELLAELEGREAFGRGAEPWEVANTMVFLASDYASYVTGETLSVSSQRA